MVHARFHIPFLVVLGIALILETTACSPATGAASRATSTAVTSSTEPTSVTPSPVATATASSSVERDGADGFRAFAGQVQAAFDQHDTAFFIQRMKGTSVACTAADLTRKGPEGKPLCAAVGATYRGFLAAPWRSEWETVPLEEAFQQIAEVIETAEPKALDMLGTGELRVDALNVAPGEYRVIATAIALRPVSDPRVGPKRVSLSLTASFEGGRWQFTSLLNAPVLAEDLLKPGTEFTSRLTGWERYRP